MGFTIFWQPNALCNSRPWHNRALKAELLKESNKFTQIQIFGLLFEKRQYFFLLQTNQDIVYYDGMPDCWLCVIYVFNASNFLALLSQS